jgi:hypothetical protein
MPRPATLGVITKSSARPVPATLEGLRAAVEERGLIVFALVDHSGEAGKAGLSMPDTKLLVFGSPPAGTPIMLAAPAGRPGSAAESTGLGQPPRRVLRQLCRPGIPGRRPSAQRRPDRPIAGINTITDAAVAP